MYCNFVTLVSEWVGILASKGNKYENIYIRGEGGCCVTLESFKKLKETKKEKILIEVKPLLHSSLICYALWRMLTLCRFSIYHYKCINVQIHSISYVWWSYSYMEPISFVIEHLWLWWQLGLWAENESGY